jgi:hypothetical protein
VRARVWDKGIKRGSKEQNGKALIALIALTGKVNPRSQPTAATNGGNPVFSVVAQFSAQN